MSDGSLYAALHKLEQEGWIHAEWRRTESNRHAKFYFLTRPDGGHNVAELYDRNPWCSLRAIRNKVAEHLARQFASVNEIYIGFSTFYYVGVFQTPFHALNHLSQQQKATLTTKAVPAIQDSSLCAAKASVILKHPTHF